MSDTTVAELDLIIRLLTETRDALVAQPPVPGGHYAAAFPAVMETTGMDGGPRGMTLDGMAMSPAQTWTPAPGKAGPASIYPNPALTPGVPNPQVTQDTIAQTIGVVGWTATIRPPVSTTSVIKAHIMARDNLPGPASLYELDHFISLELGGHPSDLENLWCQKYTAEISDGGAHQKDAVETFLKNQIVSGALTLAEAQARITEDWYGVYLSMRRLGLMPMMVAYDPDGSSDPDDNA
jgi:hypothetical protein